MKVDMEVVQKALYWRGLFITRYAAIEFGIAELVSRGFLHDAYSHLGHPPFGPAKKLKRLLQLIELPGPIAAYRADLQPRLKEFDQYGEHRHFMAHAIMVPASIDNITFQMYDHREGVYSVGELRFELKHLEQIAKSIGEISADFTALIARICREIPLAEV